MSDDAREALEIKVALLTHALKASKGYMLNALIDLKGTTPKRTAIATVTGGINMIEEALFEASK